MKDWLLGYNGYGPRWLIILSIVLIAVSLWVTVTGGP